MTDVKACDIMHYPTSIRSVPSDWQSVDNIWLKGIFIGWTADQTFT